MKLPRIRLPLFWKLFLAQWLALALLVIAALTVMRLSAADSFLNYQHAENRAAMTEDLERVEQLLRDTGSLSQTVALLDAEGFGRREADRGQRRPPPPQEDRFGPPGRGPRPGPGGRGHAPPDPDETPPTQMLDVEGNFLLPPRAPKLPQGSTRVAVKLGGQTVAYLVRPGTGARTLDAQQEFAARQAVAFYWIAAGALLITALVAAGISAFLVQRIRKLSAATRAFVRRDFSLKIDDRGGDELSELAQHFNQMANALGAHEQRQKQWLADIAHELRTPLAILGGELDALIDGVREANPDAIASLRHEVNQLGLLVDDLNLLSLAESGGLKLHRERCDLNEIARQALVRFEQPLSESGHALRLDLNEREIPVDVDVQRIEQVLANLLRNVQRHADAGPVCIRTQSTGRTCLIAIDDSGPGVPGSQREKLFDRLYRLDAGQGRERLSGSGLGLAICKGIVEAHGGRIGAGESSLGGLSILIEWETGR